MLQTLEFSLPELLERVRSGQIPMSAKAQVTYDDAALITSQPVAPTGVTPTGVTPPTSQPTNTALELFAQWDQEDAQTTPAQQAENARIYAQIETNGIPRARL